MTIYEIYPEIAKNIIFEASCQGSVNKYITEKHFALCAFSAGDTIFSPNEKDIRVGIIISGVATVVSGTGGSGCVLRNLSKGDMFGISNLYSASSPFPSMISAKNEVSCLFIDGNAFKNFIENDPQALKRYLHLLSNKIIYLNHKITVFTAGSTEKKLAVFLFENQINGLVPLPCSMSSLAKNLGLGRASLYRALDKLTELGLIVRQDKQIAIPDQEALKCFFT